MAYDPNSLSVLAYANGFTLWHYKTGDSSTTADDAGYFNGAADMVRVGDMILANVDNGGTPAAGIFLITSNTGSHVDVSNLTNVGHANTD